MGFSQVSHSVPTQAEIGLQWYSTLVDRVLQIMQQSGLSSSVLTGITDLVSPARGDFTFPNFVLSMYLLFGILEDEFVAIPAAIPDWLLEQINGLEDIKGKKRDLPRQSQAGTSAISSSLDRERAFTLDFRLYSKQASENKALDPRFCAVVPQELRDISDNYFDNLANSDQVVPGDVAVPFLLGSKLPMRDLASIWCVKLYLFLSPCTQLACYSRDLADYEQQGALNSYGFSLSILFTYRKMAGGQIPLSLPSSFLPKVVDDAQVAREEGMKSQIQQLRLENRHLRSQSMMESPETGELRRQVADLLRTLQGKTDEIAGLQQTIHSQTQNEDDQVDDPLISDQLERAEQENENLRSKLQFMADEVEAYRKTNEMLQKHVQNLTQQADHVKADSLTVQNLLREDANRQIEELRRQVNELRSSTRLPSAGDDEDIQTLINEQLASDNASLRTQVKQLQDSLAQMENRNLQPIPHARSSTPDLSAHGSISPTASQYPFPSPSIFTEGRSTEPQDGLDKRKTRKLRRRSQKDLEESFAASEALLRRRVQELQTQFQDLETRYKFELDQVRGRSTREAEESRSRAEQLQAQMDASEQDFRRRISRLTQENETLKRERERERQGTSQSQDSESVPPPAYEELLNN